jgi:hypothetical protein
MSATEATTTSKDTVFSSAHLQDLAALRHEETHFRTVRMRKQKLAAYGDFLSKLVGGQDGPAEGPSDGDDIGVGGVDVFPHIFGALEKQIKDCEDLSVLKVPDADMMSALRPYATRLKVTSHPALHFAEVDDVPRETMIRGLIRMNNATIDLYATLLAYWEFSVDTQKKRGI